MAIMRANLSIYFAVLASVAVFAAPASTVNSTVASTVNSTNAACQQLADKYPNQLYLPNSLQYVNETASMF